MAKRLELLHQLVPEAVRIAVLQNPVIGTTADAALREVKEAARVIGVQIHVVNATTIGEIDAVFATLKVDHSPRATRRW